MRIIYFYLWCFANRIRLALGHRAQPKHCCRQPKNLLVFPTRRPDLGLSICQVCQCRHFSITVDPGHIGIRGAAI